VAGLIEKPALCAAIFMRRKQSQNPMVFFAIRMASMASMVSMVAWGNLCVVPDMHYPVH